MNLVRQITTLLVLAIAGSGSVPLALHHLCCHSDSAGSLAAGFSGADESPSFACSCSHGCGSGIEKNAPSDSDQSEGPLATVEPDAGHECSICFQLSQSSCAFAANPSVSCYALQGTAVSLELSFDLAAVDCCYPPRGPPAA